MRHAIDCKDIPNSHLIAKHCPLKQGLRLKSTNEQTTEYAIAKHCPLKQGLLRWIWRCNFHSLIIAKHCPLKQGLRLIELAFARNYDAIAKQCPLKQGLRQPFFPICNVLNLYCKTLSTKTRIATSNHSNSYFHLLDCKTHSTKTRIATPLS